MQRYTRFFITVNAVHVSGGFSARRQELKNCTPSIGWVSSLLAASGSVGELELVPTHPRNVLLVSVLFKPQLCKLSEVTYSTVSKAMVL
jgi:hypothetical protein